MSRGPSAKTLLKLSWKYPVYVAPEKKTEGTTAKAMRRALSESEAFAYIAEQDRRPLLVLRECKVCNGTDDALLSRGIDNEKTFLLSRWFNCIKLPQDVLQADHPFHSLFADKNPEHLFVAAWDGSEKIPLESQTSRTELWSAMIEVLTAEYKKDPNVSLKQIAKVLDRFDDLDRKSAELQTKMDKLIETDGPESLKLRKVRVEIEDCRKELESLHKEVSKASVLPLKETASAPKQETESAGSGR